MKCLPIKNFPGYYIYTNGKVLSKNGNSLKPHFLKPNKTKNGYLQYALYDANGKIKNHLIHRLVAEYFIPNTLSLPEVTHIDKNLANNDISNLAWMDIKSNRRNRDMTNTKKKVKNTITNQEYESVTKAALINNMERGHLTWLLKSTTEWIYI